MNGSHRLWITGVGAVTPLGNGFAEFADNLLAGRSGVSSIRVYPNDEQASRTAAPIGPIPVPPHVDPAGFARLNRLHQLAQSCCIHALDDAGLWHDRSRLRVGLVLGLGAEYLRIWELDVLQGGNRIFEPHRDVESTGHALRRELDLAGPAVAVAAACASGGIALGVARRWVRSGLVDVCLSGSCDLITPMSYAGFYNLRALSRRDGTPARASRPFDRDRDGFVMGEGGAVFLVEPEAAARRRGATPYGELAGVGLSSDASHMVVPSQDPQPASRAIRLALDDAGITPDEVDYVNAHAAGTPVGDKAEARSLQLALGPAAERVPVSSTKSMTGHLLSGAAAVEALACLVALRRQAVPPTINLDHPDPECPLRHVPHQARSQPVWIAASNSFGFGGGNTCVVLRKAA